MTDRNFHVAIIGGGLGGLCLAQGLRKAGIRFTVFERDLSRASRPQGYRIHIDPQGSRALHDCLPQTLWNIFASTGGQFAQGFTVMTEQMQELLSVRGNARGGARDGVPRVDPIAQHRSISRVNLRRVLLSGIEDSVRFDKRFLRYEETPQGRVSAFFEDGSRIEADLLVAADGVHSRVRRQYLPEADPVDTGVVGIGGRVPLSGLPAQILPRQALDGPIMVVPSTPCSLFMALWKPAPEAAEFLSLLGDQPQSDDEPYLIFSLGGRPEHFGLASSQENLPGDVLLQAMRRAMIGWHPNLCALADSIHEQEFGLFPVRTSRPVPPWKPSRVTLLGDAIHSMTPYRGIGGNIALKDAALLSSRLAEAHAGSLPLLEAVASYEASMRKYAFAAVGDSRKAMEMVNGARHPVFFPVAKATMRAVNAILRARRTAAV